MFYEREKAKSIFLGGGYKSVRMFMQSREKILKVFTSTKMCNNWDNR